MNQFFTVILFFTCVFLNAQQTDYVDFKTANATIGFNVDKKELVGLVSYKFKIIKNTDSIFLDAKNIKINNIYNDYGVVSYTYNTKKIVIINTFEANKTYSITVDYTVKPNKALYFVEHHNDVQIWTQGQGKYTSNWLPSIDDVNDKIEFDLSVFYDSNYTIIANGKQIVKTKHDTHTMVKYNMQESMPSYLVALAIGKYNKKIIKSKSGIPLELYYYPKDSLKVEPTYRYTKQIFDFLEEEIAVPYPWQNYKQVPVKDFLYAGMENTTLTIFSDDFMIDNTSFIDKNYVNVNAHELAHQWFGNLVTATSSKHHWLQEGFATYYALLAERNIFGDNYYYWQLYQYAQELLMQDQAQQSTSLLNPKSSSTTFYKKGAWVLHMLREKIGHKAFKKAIKNYLEIYKFKTVETKHFIAEAEKTSGKTLTTFYEKWLQSKELHYNEMEAHLISASPIIKNHIKIDCEVYTSKCGEYLNLPLYDETKVKIIKQIPHKVKPKHFNSSAKVRQAIAQNVINIPLNLKKEYETLLNDKSYLTIEAALYNLWVNFPQDRKKYLNKAKTILGFNDKNIRTLWLTLALNTKDYNISEKQNYFNELILYTSPQYAFQVRQNVFSYLNSINAYNKNAIQNLIEASKHHNWRFKNFSKTLLKELEKNPKYKEIIVNLQLKENKQ